MSAAACTACGEALVDGARFCEACGAEANGAAAAGGVELTPGATAFGPCAKCGGEVADDGYCTSCGHRALEEVTVEDRGVMAFATHRGRRHDRNEDAAALATTAEGWPVLAVSDGVSISPNPHLASAAAVAAAADHLRGQPFAGADDLVAAVAEAHAAACAVPATGDPHWADDGTHPACTLVVAVATDAHVHVANVGDARAHLLRATGDDWTATQITTDDSVAAQAVAQGIDLEIALSLPGGHAITAWLGADAHEPDPHVAAHEVAAGDVVVVHSDGLWNYAPTDDAMGALLAGVLPRPGAPVEPLPGLCEQLVSWAVDQGGADNITVALAPVPAAAPGGPELDEPDEAGEPDEEDSA